MLNITRFILVNNRQTEKYPEKSKKKPVSIQTSPEKKKAPALSEKCGVSIVLILYYLECLKI